MAKDVPKPTLSAAEGLKVQIDALKRDYIVEPHIGVPDACNVRNSMRLRQRTVFQRAVPKLTMWSLPCRRVPDRWRCQRAASHC